jgi:hypothetical protein
MEALAYQVSKRTWIRPSQWAHSLHLLPPATARFPAGCLSLTHTSFILMLSP